MFYAVELAGHLQTSDQWPAVRLKQGRKKNKQKKKLITATYPEAEGLQVQVAQRETEMEKEREGGVITAQTSYSDSNNTGFPH